MIQTCHTYLRVTHTHTTSGLRVNPLSPHDALKHHFTSLKTDLIFLQLRVLERKFPWNWFTNTVMVIFFNFQTTSNHLHPLQVENCDSNSRLVVVEDDYGKLRIERVKTLSYQVNGLSKLVPPVSPANTSRWVYAGLMLVYDAGATL